MKTWTVVILFAAAVAARGEVEQKTTEQHSFSGAKKLILDDVLGAIDAVGYSGHELQVEVSKTVRAESAERADAAKREVKLDVNQSGEVVRVFVDGLRDRDHGWRRDGYEVIYDFKLKVPFGTFLDLRTVTHGGINLDHTAGDFDLRDINTLIELVDVAGSGNVHTINGGLKAIFARKPDRACQFNSINGALDVSFPADLSADVRMKTINGALYTDFPVAGLPLAVSAPERQNGKFLYRSRHGQAVRIGNGGPELTFETINGTVYIRRLGK
ncbi:MAG: hypothetical protein ABI165_13250 [Bryobacteraceae bacterium]